MKTNLPFAFVCVILLFASCKKFDEMSLESDQRANDFKSFIINKTFQVKAYYSDKPIDYIEDDAEVRSETDLIRYVSPWIKDDWNEFDVNSNLVTITQNAVRSNAVSADVFTRNFAIVADKQGVYFDFLTYQYNPLRYKLVEFSDNHFLVVVNLRPDVKVYTRFEVVPTSF